MIGNNPISWQNLATQDKWSVNIQKMTFGNREVKLSKQIAEIVTSESRFRMTRDDFETIENELRKKLSCTFDTNYLFYCFTNSESYSPFPPIQIFLQDIVLVVPPQDYVIFVWKIFNYTIGKRSKVREKDCNYSNWSISYKHNTLFRSWNYTLKKLLCDFQ